MLSFKVGLVLALGQTVNCIFLIRQTVFFSFAKLYFSEKDEDITKEEGLSFTVGLVLARAARLR